MFNKMLLAGAAIAAASAANAGVIFNGSGGSIPDGSGNVVSTITGPVAGTVTGFTVTINGLQHSWLGNLSAMLTHVDSGTSVYLFRKIGATNGNGAGRSVQANGDYTFSDASGANLWTTAAGLGSGGTVNPGDFRAATLNGALTSFSNFAGLSASGNWTLTLTDNIAGNSGSFSGWSLDLLFVPTPGSLALFGASGLIIGRRRR